MSNGEKNLSISEKLYKLLEQKTKQNNFATIDDYAEHILTQLLQADTTEHLSIKKRINQKENR